MSSDNTEYLFIDGGYLQKCLDAWSKKYFDGTEIDIDLQRLTSNFQKKFYYDCLPPKKKSEKKEDYRIRIEPKQKYFDHLREIDGFHVYQGSTSGSGGRARQKQVDIMIAVHMLSHAIRTNTRRMTLLSGDLDFKPVVEALIQEGMYVEVWSDNRSSSRELRYAADSTIKLNILSIWDHTSDHFQRQYPVPQRVIRMGTQDHKKEYFSQVKSCYIEPRREAYLRTNSDGLFKIVVELPGSNRGYYAHFVYHDREILERIILEEYDIVFNWS